MKIKYHNANSGSRGVLDDTFGCGVMFILTILVIILVFAQNPIP